MIKLMSQSQECLALTLGIMTQTLCETCALEGEYFKSWINYSVWLKQMLKQGRNGGLAHYSVGFIWLGVQCKL